MFLGQPSPTNVGNACGAQGLDTFSGVYAGKQVPWEVHPVFSYWVCPPHIPHLRQPLHMEQSQRHHPQHYSWEIVGGQCKCMDMGVQVWVYGYGHMGMGFVINVVCCCVLFV